MIALKTRSPEKFDDKNHSDIQILALEKFFCLKMASCLYND